MNTVEQLKTMTNKEFARALTGVGIIGFPDDIWDVDESDIDDILEQRTNNYDLKKVKALLNIFNKMEEYLESVKGRIMYLSNKIEEYQAAINREYANLEKQFDEYIDGTIVAPPQKPDGKYYEFSGYIEDARVEIDCKKYKQQLYYYAVEVMKSKLTQTTKKDTDNIFGDLSGKIEPLLQICIKKGILDSTFQVLPNKGYTKSDMALLASKILGKIGITTGDKGKSPISFKYFEDLWRIKGLSGAYYDGEKRTSTFKHKTEIDNIFK